MIVHVILEIQISQVVDHQTQNIITNGIKHATTNRSVLWIKMVKVWMKKDAMMMTLVKPKQKEIDQSNVHWIMFVLKMSQDSTPTYHSQIDQK